MYKVLLVDDEQLERTALKIILNKKNEVEIVGEASTGAKAIELHKMHQPDFIFMDIKMPGIDGLEATEIIKEKNKNVVIIILTAYDDFEYAQRALRLGADDYILKPARPEDIIKIVEKYIMRQPDKKIETNSLEELSQLIYNEEYKSSKEKLKIILQQLFKVHGQSVEALKTQAEEVARRMIDVCEEKGLTDIIIQNNQDIFADKVNKNIVENKLFDILDNIFDQLISSKSFNETDEIKVALNYIEKNFNRGITLEEVAEYVHLSPHYLSKLFKKQLEVNFVNYVTQRRMERAKELLRNSDVPILNIAMELSYNEPNYFSKVFKKVVGMTPTEYRESQIKDHMNRRGLTKKYNKVSNGKWYI